MKTIRNLLDDLDDPDTRVFDPNYEMFYKTVERIGPSGQRLVIDVEIYLDLDDDTIASYATVSLGQNLPQGLAIQPEAVIELSDQERAEFLADSEVMESLQMAAEDAEEVEQANEDWDRNR